MSALRKELQKHEPTADDLFADHLRRECAAALIAWLKGSVNVDRSIRSLKRADFENMAEAVTARWIVEVSKRKTQGPDSEEVNKLYALLA